MDNTTTPAGPEEESLPEVLAAIREVLDDLRERIVRIEAQMEKPAKLQQQELKR